MKTICIMNNKGGVGKTVTAVNLADNLVRRHYKRVALIDCDGQANLTRFFFPTLDLSTVCTTASVLTGDCEPIWRDNLIPIEPGLELLPASAELYSLDHRAIRRGTLHPDNLIDFIQIAKEDDDVDYMIFDCPPGYTLASVGALLYADAVVIPMTVDGFAFTGVQDILHQIAQLDEVNVNGRIAGVLITQWKNTDVVRQGEQLLRSQKDLPVFRQVIRRTDKIPESTFARQPVGRYSPNSAAAQDYRRFTSELLEVIS